MQKQQSNISFLLPLAVVLFLFGCKNENRPLPTPEPRQKQVHIAPQYKAEDRLYKAHWGAIELPVIDDPLPPNKAKEHVVSIDSLNENFFKPITFTKGDKQMALDLVAVVIQAPTGRTLMYHYDADDGFAVTEDWSGEQLREYIQWGAHLSLRGFVDNVPINSVGFTIGGETQPYAPPAYFNPVFGAETEVFGFQLYRAYGRKTIVRLDTTVSATHAIYDMYRNKTDKYQILHIPGFKTVRRYFSDDEKLWPSNDFTRKIFLNRTKDLPLEMETFAEYHEVKDKPYQMEWGRLTSPNLIKTTNRRGRPVWYYAPQDSLTQKAYQALRSEIHDVTPVLTVGKERFELVRFDCWVTSTEAEDYRLVTETLDHPEIAEILLNLPKNSSVYFDNVLIKNKEGEIVWFPMSFVFNFL